eukprot:4357499-Prymnesium_polylepis.1
MIISTVAGVNDGSFKLLGAGGPAVPAPPSTRRSSFYEPPPLEPSKRFRLRQSPRPRLPPLVTPRDPSSRFASQPVSIPCSPRAILEVTRRDAVGRTVSALDGLPLHRLTPSQVRRAVPHARGIHRCATVVVDGRMCTPLLSRMREHGHCAPWHVEHSGCASTGTVPHGTSNTAFGVGAQEGAPAEDGGGGGGVACATTAPTPSLRPLPPVGCYTEPPPLSPP